MSLFGDGEREIAKAIMESTHELLYKRIPRPTKISKQEQKAYEEIVERVDDYRFMTGPQKTIYKHKLWLDLTTIEVERFNH